MCWLGFCSARFSLRILVFASTNPRRLKPAQLALLRGEYK